MSETNTDFCQNFETYLKIQHIGIKETSLCNNLLLNIELLTMPPNLNVTFTNRYQNEVWHSFESA